MRPGHRETGQSESNHIPAERAEPRSTTWELGLGLRPRAGGEGDGAGEGLRGEAQGEPAPSPALSTVPSHHLPTC